ncbi:hypothetical protein HCN44_003864 [Aphidius gifuensis]|uniref:Calpain catalytic domain-containing protein n=1 Tax=Aphidius gifuensis TaxID=684658 RepID=A0A834XXH3_APHGI|nr:hypothetical protein HCN44_003864 [Aphidius gifuensis]
MKMPALIEKAYAKLLYRSYEKLIGGFSRISMQDLSGGISELYGVESTSNNLFNIIQDAKYRSTMISGSTRDKDEFEKIFGTTVFNIEPSHSYAVTSVKIVTGDKTDGEFKLIRIRDPYSKAAVDLYHGNIKDLFTEATLASELNTEIDGESWILYEDFIKYFSYVHICNLTPNKIIGHVYSNTGKKLALSAIKGKFMGAVTLKQVLSDNFYKINPQYRMVLTESDEGKNKSTVLIGVSLKHRYDSEKFSTSFINFQIISFDADDTRRIPKPLFTSFIKHHELGLFRSKGQVGKRIDLEPGTYYIIPFIMDTFKGATFYLQILSEQQDILEVYDRDIHMPHITEKEIFEEYGDKKFPGYIQSQLISTAFKRAGYPIDLNVVTVIYTLFGSVNGLINFKDFALIVLAFKNKIGYCSSVRNVPSTSKASTSFQRTLSESSSERSLQINEPVENVQLTEFINGEIVELEQQDFCKLRQGAMESDTPFKDPQFPKKSFSLDQNRTRLRRPKDIAEKPVFYFEDNKKFHIKQGFLKNCWFIVGLLHLQNHRDLFHFIVQPYRQTFEENYAGIFHFRFWQAGTWVDVVVDDRLAFERDDGEDEDEDSNDDYLYDYDELVYASSGHKNEFWPSLIEKAYAKLLYRSYEKFIGGYPGLAMQDLSGCIAETSMIHTSKDYLFDILQDSIVKATMISCTTKSDNQMSNKNEIKKFGLDSIHAYAITGVKIVRGKYPDDEFRVIRLRDPTGSGTFHPYLGNIVKVLPESSIKTELKVKVSGEIWILLEDFFNYFDSVDICNLTPSTIIGNVYAGDSETKLVLSKIEGKMIGGTNIGEANDEDIMENFPQYRLTTTEKDIGKDNCSVLIGLSLKRRHDAAPVIQTKMMFRIIHASGNQRVSKPLRHIKYSQITDSHIDNGQVSFRMAMEPHSTYYIIPCVGETFVGATFFLQVLSQHKTLLEEYDRGVYMPNLANKFNNLKSADIEISDNDLFLSMTFGNDHTIDFKGLHAISRNNTFSLNQNCYCGSVGDDPSTSKASTSFQRTLSGSSSEESLRINEPVENVQLTEFINGEIVELEQQDFFNLRKTAIETDTPFQDPQFPKKSFSLIHDRVLRRPKDIVGKPVFYFENNKRFHIQQGNLGNCWFIVGLLHLQYHKNLFEFIVQPKYQTFEENYAGIFHFRFWQAGKWVDVVVDDLLAFERYDDEDSNDNYLYNYDELVYASSGHTNEFWPCLIEKAAAKLLYRSYKKLEGGLPGVIMQDLSGGIIETYMIGRTRENLYHILQGSLVKTKMISCETLADEEMENEIEEFGLDSGHAYAITDVKIITEKYSDHEFKVIRLRDPSGSNINNTHLGNIVKVLPESSIETKLKIEVDGDIWILYEDFVKYFQSFDICNLTPNRIIGAIYAEDGITKLVLSTIEGKWIGGINIKEEIHGKELKINPQYRLITTEKDIGKDKCSVLIGLSLKRRDDLVPVSKTYIAFRIIIARDNQEVSRPLKRKNYPHADSVIINSPFGFRVDLDPSSTYYIIPCVGETFIGATFFLQVLSQHKTILEEYDSDISMPNMNDKFNNLKSAQIEASDYELFSSFKFENSQTIDFKGLHAISRNNTFSLNQNCRAVYRIDDSIIPEMELLSETKKFVRNNRFSISRMTKITLAYQVRLKYFMFIN